MTTENDTEFNETTTLRDAWEAIKARLSSGGDVTPDELVDAEKLAEAEVQIETARRSNHEKRKTKREQDAAAKRADELAKKIDPEINAASKARIDEAYENYLSVIEAEVEASTSHNANVWELARACRDAGAPVVAAGDKHTGDRVVPNPGDWNSQTPNWRGVTYSLRTVTGEYLPHVRQKSSKRVRSLEQRRGSIYG